MTRQTWSEAEKARLIIERERELREVEELFREHQARNAKDKRALP